MSQRYFVETPISAEHVLLSGSEGHHLAHVMRAKVGDEVSLFDGTGHEFIARVEDVRRGDVRLQIVSRTLVDRELGFELTLGVALPKGERQRWLVEKATELGVTRLIPLNTARGVVQPSGSTLERLRRGVIEASKQCGRNKLLEIAEPLDCHEYVALAPSGSQRLIAHPQMPGGGLAINAAGLQTGPAQAVSIAVGPEGGFTDDEMELVMAAGWQAVDLGPRILRVETAAIFLAALAISANS